MEGEIAAAAAVIEVADVARKASYSEVFASRQFIVVLSSKFLAVSADTIRIVALSVLIYVASNSPLLSALSFGIGFLPQVIGTSLLGAIADRYGARPRLMLAEVMEAGTTALLALVHLPIWAMLLLLGTNAALTPPLTSNSRLLTQLLKGDAFVLGRSLLNMSSQVAQLVGLGAAGFLVAGVGVRHSLLVCAAAHGVALLTLVFLKGDVMPLKSERQGSLVVESWQGQKEVLQNAPARRVLFVQWGPSLFAAMAESVLVAYCLKNGFGAHAPGLLMACYPIGLIIGDIAVGKGFTPPTRERLVPGLILLLGLPLLPFAFSPPLALSMVLIVLSGSGFSYALGVQRVFVEVVPDKLRGQSFTLLSAGMMTVQGIGALVSGSLSEWLGIGPSMAVAGGLTLATAAWWLVVSGNDEKMGVGRKVEGGVA